MNNAGVGNNPGKPWENLDAWRKLIDINFWGVVHGVQAFGERMLVQGTPAMIVNTGSKQGITTPPGNLCYNVSKAALKTYTEGLAHALRNEPGAKISAHLLIPGFTYTGLTEGAKEKPAGAWTPEQVVGFMLESNLEAGSQAIPEDRSKLRYGVSVTDPCIDWETTEKLLLGLDTRLRTASRFARGPAAA